jgi:hypothetical protein
METYIDKTFLTTTVAADGETRLLIRVESPSFQPYEIAIRAKQTKNIVLTFPVEMLSLETNV